MAAVTIKKRLPSKFLHAIRFMRRHYQALLLWPLGCICLGVLIWNMAASRLAYEHMHIRENGFKEAASLAKSYAEQLSRSLQQIDHTTLYLQYEWEQSSGKVDLRKLSRAGLYPASAKLYLSIIDRNGAMVTSTSGNQGPPASGDQDWFLWHRNHATRELLISEPTSAYLPGKTVIRFSRRLDAADGKFGGIVTVAAEPAYLASVADDSHLGNGNFLSAWKSDGMLLAVKTGNAVHTRAPLFRTAPAFGPDSGVTLIAGDAFIDGQSHIVAWQKLKDYPLVSIVGLSEQEALESYEKIASDYHQMAMVGTIFLLVLMVTGVFFSLRLAWRKQQAEEVKNTYRLATDGAREGFYILRALRGRNRVIVDFLIVDCNERGAALYGTTREKIIGKKFSDFAAPPYVRRITATCARAMESGFYEDEYRVSPRSPLKAAWIQRRLVRSGNGLAMTLRDISDTKMHEEALSRLANADAVTMLPNRHWLMTYLPTAVEQAKRTDTVLALLFIDLDDFKNINDTLGHAAGDELLQSVARRFKSVIRPQDSVVRLGGDEFTVILEQVDSAGDVEQVAERIVKALGEPFVLAHGTNHKVLGSIGISMFPRDGADGETLLKHADIAMYAAKENGKGHYRFYQPSLSENLVIRLGREQSLRDAIERDEFVLFYQPRVDTFSGEMRGMEALLRWQHPQEGVVAPSEFIEMAEQTGLIVPLGELVIEKACAQLARWKAMKLPVVPVSINVSPRQFNQGRLSAMFSSAMARHGIDASLIEIEITESCMAGEAQAVSAELASIEQLGVRLLVDDFGTGYSSLSQLKRMEMDGLKVDRTFTAQLGNGREDEAFFMAILSMAHVLGMSVVAEGVETVEQLQVLQALSCNEIQGYLVSRPVPAHDVPALMLKRFLLPVAQPALLAL